MTESTDSHVVIGLKDVYQMVQGLERALSDSLGNLNLTLAGIKNHMEQTDARNAAADLLHKEHAERLRRLEDLTVQADPLGTHAKFESRIQTLEDSQISETAVTAAATRARKAFWAAVAAAAAAATALAAVLQHITIH